MREILNAETAQADARTEGVLVRIVWNTVCAGPWKKVMLSQVTGIESAHHGTATTAIIQPTPFANRAWRAVM